MVYSVTNKIVYKTPFLIQLINKFVLGFRVDKTLHLSESRFSKREPNSQSALKKFKWPVFGLANKQPWSCSEQLLSTIPTQQSTKYENNELLLKIYWVHFLQTISRSSLFRDVYYVGITYKIVSMLPSFSILYI